MSEYSLMWLSDKRMYRELRKIAKTWPGQDVNGIEKLGLILFETWSAVQGLQPFPDVCLLSHEDKLVGILCGSISFQQRNFNIQHLVIAPLHVSTQILYDEAYDKARNKLVEAAIDVSQNHGFHGWVSCSPEEGDIPVFSKMGFRRHHDGLTYRRMGYFTQL